MPAPDLLPPDDFSLAADDPLAEAHRWIQSISEDVRAQGRGINSEVMRPHLDDLNGPRDDVFRAGVLRAAARRLRHAGGKFPTTARLDNPSVQMKWIASGSLCLSLLDHLTVQGKGRPRGTTWGDRAIGAPDAATVADLAAVAAEQAGPSAFGLIGEGPIRHLLRGAKPLAKRGELSDEARTHFAAAAARCRGYASLRGYGRPFGGFADRLDCLARPA